MEIECPNCSEQILLTDDQIRYGEMFECPFCLHKIELEPTEEETQPEENAAPKETVFCEVCKETSERVDDAGRDEYFDCPNPLCNATINFLGRVPPMLGAKEESTISEEHRQLLASKLLIQCPACFKAVSKQADVCPSCGHPIYRGVLGKAGASRIINITVLVLLVSCVFFCLIANPFIRP